MDRFNGFPEGKVHLTPIPGQFFDELLQLIDHLGELKLTLHFFWRLDQIEGSFRYLRHEDLQQDQRFLEGLSKDPQQAQEFLNEALKRAVARGTLLEASLQIEHRQETLYFLNSPRGRAAIQAIQNGQWRPTSQQRMPIEISQSPPNIFRLYEENIGPLTPLLAESLGEAEDTYPAPWIEEAIRIAVEKNKRNWRYISAILERWQREGRDAQKGKLKDRRDTEKDYRRFVEGEYSDFIER